MRIIAGSLKGRRLAGPTGPGLRPTSDRLRETLFNVLRDSVVDARVLDGFAGTGALGLEALSRGAAHAVFVELEPRSLAVLRQNVASCGVSGSSTIVRADFAHVPTGLLSGDRFDLVLLDPPYDLAGIDNVLLTAGSLVTAGGRLVLEHSRRRPSPEIAGPLARTRVLPAGDSALSFYA